jgi:hypothetical protein
MQERIFPRFHQHISPNGKQYKKEQFLAAAKRISSLKRHPYNSANPLMTTHKSKASLSKHTGDEKQIRASRPYWDQSSHITPKVKMQPHPVKPQESPIFLNGRLTKTKLMSGNQQCKMMSVGWVWKRIVSLPCKGKTHKKSLALREAV